VGTAPKVVSGPDAGRVPALDGLRGIAILMVMLFHFVYLDPTRVLGPFGLIGLYLRYGYTGVNLFFVLSGFLISGILLDAKSEPHYFRNFYARRILRIFPLYYGYLIVALVLGRAFSYYGSTTLRLEAQSQVWLWTYTSNLCEAFHQHYFDMFRHFWSLAVEEQFYLVWPVVILLAPRRRLTWICIGGVVVGPSARILLKLATGLGL